ncbi:dihydropteroate synthase [Botrimarina hoheduenensis]|uniref:dihydropteroate synthase n=1 Tax=Botrimarina hoheduenensis TaxID=2528000 RepID=UPI001E47634F|nr:dihydropteroate synthase [Botrimarina hoheduenensis]
MAAPIPRLPDLMGIVNVTPDSFSDGGLYLDAEQAVQHALQLETDGAAILDVGGESTRPGAKPVDAQEESRRVLPVIRQLAESTRLPISIDTSKASVARAAITAGATIVNDVTGLTGDPEMLRVVADSDCRVCVMHMQGTPRTMQEEPRYSNVVAEVMAYLAGKRDALVAAGVSNERIWLDPGIGFGKTLEHNLELLSRIAELHALGCKLLVGHSRKKFLGQILGDQDADRTAATAGVAVHLADAGVQVLRVHDVLAVSEVLRARQIAARGRLDAC